MKRLSTALFILLVCTGQAQKIQDLVRESKAAKPESREHVDLLNQIAWEYRDMRPDSMLYYANRALQLAEKHNYINLKIKALNFTGVAYRNLSIYSKSLERYLEALKLAEDHHDGEQLGYALINIANLYLFQKDYLAARSYLIRALDQSQKLANKNMQAYSFINLGRVHRELKEFELAEQYLDQAAKIREELGDMYGVIAAEMDKAEVMRLKGALNAALNAFTRLIPRIEAVDDKRALTRVYNNIAKIHLTSGNLPKAEEAAREALKVSQGVSSRYDEKEALGTLSSVLAGKGHYEQALEYHLKYSNLNYQLFNEENIRQIEQLKNQYVMEKQETENELLRQRAEADEIRIGRQRIIIFGLWVGSFMLLAVAFVSYRAYLVRKRLSNEIQGQKDQMEKDKNIIEQQANKLRELDEAKSRFFANVSHDLRTPLSLILGNLELVMEDKESAISAASKKRIETSFKNSKRLLYLTDEINDITRLEEGKIKLKKENVQIVPYIKVLVDMFRSSAEYKGVTLDFEPIVPSTEVVLIDPRQFEKIFYNLVSNAIRHTKSGDSITIRALRSDGHLHLEFEDTGEGIHPDALPYIFDRFYQSKHNEYNTREGLGIGLALVKDLMELHQGKITLQSTLGKGTTFVLEFESVTASSGLVSPASDYVSLRQSTDRDLTSKTGSRVVTPIDRDKRQRILIVDDHPEIRYYIRQLLEEDYDVLEAAHGIEALELLKNQPADLIISDLMMPWMDGFELIEELQQDEDFSKIPILIVSARITDTDKEKALIKGINDYLQKPFEKKELVYRINNLLEMKNNWSNGDNPFAEMASRQKLDHMGQEIIKKLEDYIKDHIDDVNLSVLHLADAVAASERQVYRLIKKVTGLTPHEYIVEVRMQFADYLIRKNKVKSASEAARSVGIRNVTTFNRQYEKKFGVKPAEILE
jgi:signal transduction histidine kinase/DNA-binding response OmpR family regulator